jgi:hypothetical protein
MIHEISIVDAVQTDWYFKLYNSVLEQHTIVNCRQGIAYESPRSLVVSFNPARDFTEAIKSAILPRQGDIYQKIEFSILYSLRRILGYHDTVLFDKYPFLAKYGAPQFQTYYRRSIAYTLAELPTEEACQPWVYTLDVDGKKFYAIDQIQRVVHLLSNPKTRHTKRALVDFGEGYKARCMKSWLFTIRQHRLNMFQHMRSNDLVAGMPNNLIDGRLTQAIMSAIVGYPIGFMQHQADLFMIFDPDIAGQNGLMILERLQSNYRDWTPSEVDIDGIQIVQQIKQLLEEYRENEVASATDGMSRYLAIFDSLEKIFWASNTECSFHHRQCVEHLFNRYRSNNTAF